MITHRTFSSRWTSQATYQAWNLRQWGRTVWLSWETFPEMSTASVWRLGSPGSDLGVVQSSKLSILHLVSFSDGFLVSCSSTFKREKDHFRLLSPKSLLKDAPSPTSFHDGTAYPHQYLYWIFKKAATLDLALLWQRQPDITRCSSTISHYWRGSLERVNSSACRILMEGKGLLMAFIN